MSLHTATLTRNLFGVLALALVSTQLPATEASKAGVFMGRVVFPEVMPEWMHPSAGPDGHLPKDAPDYPQYHPTPCFEHFMDRGCMPHCMLELQQCVRGFHAAQDVVPAQMTPMSSLLASASDAASGSDEDVDDARGQRQDLGGSFLQIEESLSPLPESAVFLDKARQPQLLPPSVVVADKGQMFVSQMDVQHVEVEAKDGVPLSESQLGMITIVAAVFGALVSALLIYFMLQDGKDDTKPCVPSGEVCSRHLMYSETPAQAPALELLERRWVETLSVHSHDEVKRTFRRRGGYDCLLAQPQEASVSVRVEGRVVVKPTGVLQAPLSGRNCVMFSTSACELRLDGVNAPPVAFHTMTSDFDIELLPGATGSSPATSSRIRVSGHQVALFDMVGGKRQEQVVLSDAPEDLHNFVHTHRVAAPAVGTAGALAGSMERTPTMLEFTECSLDADAIVTVVGKLRRVATGALELTPCNALELVERLSEDGFVVQAPLTVDKVLVSDDPALLTANRPPAFSISSALLPRSV